MAKFGTNPDGNSVAGMLADGANALGLSAGGCIGP